MKESIKEANNKSYKTWSKKTSKNDFTRELRVEEIENGFLVCLETYGQKNGKYTSDYKKYYSKDNPLSDDDLMMDNGLDSAITKFLEEM